MPIFAEGTIDLSDADAVDQLMEIGFGPRGYTEGESARRGYLQQFVHQRRNNGPTEFSWARDIAGGISVVVEVSEFNWPPGEDD